MIKLILLFSLIVIANTKPIHKNKCVITEKFGNFMQFTYNIKKNELQKKINSYKPNLDSVVKIDIVCNKPHLPFINFKNNTVILNCFKISNETCTLENVIYDIILTAENKTSQEFCLQYEEIIDDETSYLEYRKRLLPQEHVLTKWNMKYIQNKKEELIELEKEFIDYMISLHEKHIHILEDWNNQRILRNKQHVARLSENKDYF